MVIGQTADRWMDRRTSGGADEGEKAGHSSIQGYPMTLFTNYGSSWTCTPKIVVLGKPVYGQKLLTVLVGQTDGRMDGHSDRQRWSCRSFFFLWVSHEPAHKKSFHEPAHQKVIVLGKLAHGQKCLRVLVGPTGGRTDGQGWSWRSFSLCGYPMNIHIKNCCSR